MNSKTQSSTALSACVLVSFAATFATAATYNVSTVSDLSARAASAVSGDVIRVVPGTYLLTSTLNVPNAGVSIVAAGVKAATVLDGSSAGRILSVGGEGFKVEGITFRNGRTTGNGGAICYSSSSVAQTTVIKNCEFVDCVAKYGGAVYSGQNSYSSFQPRENYGIVSGCTFLRCGIDSGESDNNGGGGAICGALWVENSVFDACFCTTHNVQEYHLAIDVPSYMTITNCIFRNHTNITRGLVGSKEGRDQQGCARLVDCLIANNTTSGGDDVLFHRKVILDRCVISNNATTVTSTISSLYRLDASGDRGFSRATSCLFIDNKYPFDMATMPPLLNCTFVRNVGGLACDYKESLKFAVTNCVFWGNTPKTDWPYGASFKGVPGLYWHPSTKLGDFVQLANVVIERGNENADVVDVLAADTSGRSTQLTAAAATSGPGFKDAANGDWTLRKVSVLVDAGVRQDWMGTARDLAGNLRCLKSGTVNPAALPDIGCYEFRSTQSFTVYFR